nr:Maf family protein [Jannaschia sp. S6380]
MLILASASQTRRDLLQNAAIPFEVRPARIDEEVARAALVAEGHAPRDVADALAELKALRLRADGIILGCDQTVDHRGMLLSKPETPADAVAQLGALSSGTHKLHSAIVAAQEGRAVWRHVATVTMTMRRASPAYLADYVDRNWPVIRHSAGSYTLEGEGARLFTRVDGDYFAVLGLPLLPLVDWLIARGEIPA